jgi:NTE family protein
MATAIVTAGAGARGAYEAGVLSRVLPRILDDEKETKVVLVGTSAGAINTAIMAGAAGEGAGAIGDKLATTWGGLSVDKVFEGKVWPLLAYAAEALGVRQVHSYALLDTAPLHKTVIDGGYVVWPRLQDKFSGTWLKAAGIVATKVSSGESVVFVEGLGSSLPDPNRSRGIVYRDVTLGPAHVLASAAIPIAFSSIEVNPGEWFVDGGVRLNTPIAPAIDLLEKVDPGGNNRIIIVSTEPDPDRVEGSSSRPITESQPDILDEAASIMYSALVDRVAEDVLSLRQVNAVIKAAATPSPAVGQGASPPSPAGQGAAPDFRVIEHCYFGPASRGHIASAAGEAFKERSQPLVLRILSHVIGNQGKTHDELLSFLFFDATFLKTLFAMGARDADALMVGGKLPWTT